MHLSGSIVADKIGDLELKRIRITRIAILLALSFSIVLGITSTLLEVYPVNIVFIVYSYIYAVIYLFHRFEFHGFAKSFLYGSLLTHVASLGLSLGSQEHVKVFYIPIAIVPFIIFGAKEKFLLRFFIILTIINIAIVYTVDFYNPFQVTRFNREWYAFMNNWINVICVFCMLVLAYMFLSLSEFGELLLINNSKELESQQKQLFIINDELKKSRDEQERLNAVKDQLLSIISHDLRRPILHLHGIIDLMVDGKVSMDELRQNAVKFKHSAVQTGHLLDNLIKWSGSQFSGMLPEKKPVHIKTLVEGIFEQIKYSSEIKDIKLVNGVDEDAEVWADIEMTEIVLRNLISNAIKFSFQKKIVRVLSIIKNEVVQVHVEDQGVGMSKEIIGKLFEADLDKKRTGTNMEKGSGIGLLLSKYLVDLNNGRIYAQSEPRVKTVMTIELPNYKQNEKYNNMNLIHSERFDVLN